MAALGGHHLVAIFIFIPHQNRLPQSGPGREQSFSAAVFDLTSIENAKIFSRKVFDTVAGGAQIVQNDNLSYVQLVDKILGIHDPRKICGSDAISNHRPSKTKTGGFDPLANQVGRGPPRKFLHDAAELRKFLACKSLLENKSELAVFFREQREITLRTADIPSKDHQLPLDLREILPGIFYDGLCQCLPSRSRRTSDSCGPQLPAGYCGTAALFAAVQTSRIGSISAQAASTLSPRSKSVASPRTQSFTSVAYALRGASPNPSLYLKFIFTLPMLISVPGRLATKEIATPSSGCMLRIKRFGSRSRSRKTICGARRNSITISVLRFARRFPVRK